MTLGYILLAVAAVSLLGLSAGMLLLWQEKLAKKISHFLVSFGAGALIGVTFFDLLPEALELGSVERVMTSVLIGFVLFYIVEKALGWYHCHDADHCESKAPVYLIVAGDFVHNFIDGMLLSATFLIDVRLGIAAAIGVLLHELPQEVGDFGILLHSGLKKGKVIAYNLLSAAGALVGAVLVFFFEHQLEGAQWWLLAIVAGNFLYIAAVDLIPATHHHDDKTSHTEVYHVFAFLLGVMLMWVVSTQLAIGAHSHDIDHAQDEHIEEVH